MEFSMSEFRARLPELLAKAWAGERLVVVHRPGNGKVRRFVICREKMEMEAEANGKLSISRVTSSHGPDCIELRLREGKDSTVMTLTLADFAGALTGLGHTKCNVTRRTIRTIGESNEAGIS
jgi:hypothetical protein